MFPVPAELSAEVNLDITHHAGLVFESAPEVLITPSILKQFVKVVYSFKCRTILTDGFAKWVDGTIVINPSFLTKGNFAVLNVKPALPGKERLSCDIHKLH